MLKFYGPFNPMGSCRVRSVYLTTRLLGRLSTLSSNQYCAHSFARNWQLPFLNQRKGENDCRKYFTINLHKRMLPTSAGVEPATSWSPVGRASNWATEAGWNGQKNLKQNLKKKKKKNYDMKYINWYPLSLIHISLETYKSYKQTSAIAWVCL